MSGSGSVSPKNGTHLAPFSVFPGAEVWGRYFPFISKDRL